MPQLFLVRVVLFLCILQGFSLVLDHVPETLLFDGCMDCLIISDCMDHKRVKVNPLNSAEDKVSSTVHLPGHFMGIDLDLDRAGEVSIKRVVSSSNIELDLDEESNIKNLLAFSGEKVEELLW